MRVQSLIGGWAKNQHKNMILGCGGHPQNHYVLIVQVIRVLVPACSTKGKVWASC